MILQTITLTASQQDKLLAAVTTQLVILMLDPKADEEFAALYNAQVRLAKLFGFSAESVSTVLSQAIVNQKRLGVRVSLPPDTPSSPTDLPSVGYVGQDPYHRDDADRCDCGHVDCCYTEPEEDDTAPEKDDAELFDRLEVLERASVRAVERMNRLEDRIGEVNLRTYANNDRTDTIQKEVQHWHERIDAVWNELQQLKQSLKTLLHLATIPPRLPEGYVKLSDLSEIDDIDD